MSQVSQVPSAPSLGALLAPGVEAIRRSWKPFVLLQGLALLLVVGYFRNDAVRSVCEHLARLKDQWGLLYSAAAAVVAGVVLPELAKSVVGVQRTLDRQRRMDIGFALGAFALNGVITDLQYRGLAVVFGADNDLGTVVWKVVTDQFVTTPLYGVPYWILAYRLRANRYSLARTLGEISPAWYVRKVLPLLIPCWFYWIPMVAMIYSLPGDLQLSLFAMALAAWSLVMIFIAQKQAAAPVPSPAITPSGEATGGPAA
jgi:hypothetical protein